MQRSRNFVARKTPPIHRGVFCFRLRVSKITNATKSTDSDCRPCIKRLPCAQQGVLRSFSGWLTASMRLAHRTMQWGPYVKIHEDGPSRRWLCRAFAVDRAECQDARLLLGSQPGELPARA